MRDGWSSDVTLLAKVAQSQPHAAYSAFTKGLASCWVYVSRTVPDIDTYMRPLEDVICCVLIPALKGRAPPMVLSVITLLYLLGGVVLDYVTPFVVLARSLVLLSRLLNHSIV